MGGLNDLLSATAAWLGVSPFALNATLAVLLLGLTCGMVGSLVVANRMAFFSDAMAHTAFAGVALGLLSVLLVAGPAGIRDPWVAWLVPAVMVATGVLVGVGIASVREQTGLTNDTVIGVFFALAIGLGAAVLPSIPRSVGDPEAILFGSVALADGSDLAALAGLAAVITVVVWRRYNALVLASFNPSLARSRGVGVRWDSYVFIVALALVVNLSVRSVGVLLINALLVVPTAAAANLGRNLRQVFWLSVLGSMAAGVLGVQLSYLGLRVGPQVVIRPGASGCVILVCVGWFFATALYASVRGRRGRVTAAG